MELSRCVSKLDEKKKAARVNRWNAIAQAAAKQSKRAIVPKVSRVMSLEEALDYSGSMEHKLIPYELSGNLIPTGKLMEAIKPGEDLCFFIGPEGGFEETEVASAKASGFTEVSLGKRILRTETAALVMLSWFIYLFEIRN